MGNGKLKGTNTAKGGKRTETIAIIQQNTCQKRRRTSPSNQTGCRKNGTKSKKGKGNALGRVKKKERNKSSNNKGTKKEKGPDWECKTRVRRTEHSGREPPRIRLKKGGGTQKIGIHETGGSIIGTGAATRHSKKDSRASQQQRREEKRHGQPRENTRKKKKKVLYRKR